MTDKPDSNGYRSRLVPPVELAAWLRDQPDGILLDVREPLEQHWAALKQNQVRHAPFSQLVEDGLAALPPELADPARPVIVFCHVGMRSAQVTAWLISQGWTKVFDLAGGIDAYAAQVDPSVGRY